MTHYIFGYGSLINARSRIVTAMTGAAVAVRVKGYKRGWISAVQSDHVTYLGVEPDDKASSNGVLVRVDESDLPQFDKRESVYRRKPVSASAISPITSVEPPRGTIWIYESISPHSATVDCPIVQSYVDVVLDGCLSFGEEFAKEFIRSSSHWEGPWLNDRKRPRYPRRLPDLSTLSRIDELLAEEHVLMYRRQEQNT